MKYQIQNDQIIRSAIPSKFRRPNGQTIFGGYHLRTDLHDEDGWVDELIPEFDPEFQQLGERYFNSENNVVTWTVVDIELPTLADLQAQKKEQFQPILAEFTTLINQAKLISGESTELTTVIETIKTVKENTITAIDSFTEVVPLMRFQFRQEDIEAMKALLKPFLL